MAVDMNSIILYYPLPHKPLKPLQSLQPLSIKPSIHEHHLLQPASIPSAQFVISELPFIHPSFWPSLPLCRDILSGFDSQIDIQALNAPLNEFNAELECLKVIKVIDMSSCSSTDQNDVELFSITEQLIIVNLKSDGENSLNDDEFRRMIGLNMCIDTTDRGIVDTSFSLKVKSEPGIPINSEKHNEKDSSDDDNNSGKMYQKSDDNDHVTRQLYKQ
ncbi:conserved hypothetical protein [Histoplasma capsulatum var. duboisii H88]|uniref:Uncharacterized protein n=1 Tax=Ajellomyces capsulatus (strain H88) TaxID=544711 RepID=F0US44_AJEC8|nr:conserved hypothetical protein [Histoplasma capsulatum var. duboisii H88]